MEITKDKTLFFDMDGTLIDTDFSNFLSYEKAIQSVIKTNEKLTYSPKRRLNRLNLRSKFPNISDCDYRKIVILKEEFYKENLHHTKLNKEVEEILLQYYKTNKCVLVTNCRKERAMLTLNYHNLTKKFCNLFFGNYSDNNKRINKYENAISIMGLSPHNIIVFENESQEIEYANKAGIVMSNILSI
ncbi:MULTISPECIES: HAD family hydrolase [Mesonia]|mgnify:FL=1|uniref:Phosphorylated carbohydrates phosphatase n=1 Tax=Mesonia oceanica TaxID=2687242 RepID=A0AC61YCV4_9FLAO|nr:MULTISPECIES: HAD family hydrolase [Mesonia]MAN29412.1 hypothetical protein [Mesonia sp.]MAS72885.1 hypothetical protein [Zunongwangia sp.]VVV02238.1 Phosphorylated carbohydrates phosphatase [Mesonia oceanica]|tara:strand:- start:3097 stop:3657 length:561 start_codon:yes stop_codon:yes gene_type:complete